MCLEVWPLIVLLQSVFEIEEGIVISKFVNLIITQIRSNIHLDISKYTQSFTNY